MKQCSHCGKEFTPSRLTQKYCLHRNYQKYRNLAWQKTKMQTDLDYKANQREAQKRWSEKNNSYWKRYRASHLGYTAHNRQLQHQRNDLRSTVCLQDGGEVIAKMDAKLVRIQSV